MRRGQKLIDAAKAAGRTITEDAGGRIWIRCKGRKVKGILMYQDGSIFATDVDLAVAACMTQKQAREFLQIPQ